jgi:hypothetical protein
MFGSRFGASYAVMRAKRRNNLKPVKRSQFSFAREVEVQQKPNSGFDSNQSSGICAENHDRRG